MSLQRAGDRVVYECGACRAKGVKLWRDYSTFLNNVELRCFFCAIRQEKLTFDRVRRFGAYERYSTDQLGSLVPAVLTVEGDTFWGYSSVPEDCVALWNALPLFETPGPYSVVTSCRQTKRASE